MRPGLGSRCRRPVGRGRAEGRRKRGVVRVRVPWVVGATQTDAPGARSATVHAAPALLIVRPRVHGGDAPCPPPWRRVDCPALPAADTTVFAAVLRAAAAVRCSVPSPFRWFPGSAAARGTAGAFTCDTAGRAGGIAQGPAPPGSVLVEVGRCLADRHAETGPASRPRHAPPGLTRAAGLSKPAFSPPGAPPGHHRCSLWPGRGNALREPLCPATCRAGRTRLIAVRSPVRARPTGAPKRREDPSSRPSGGRRGGIGEMKGHPGGNRGAEIVESTRARPQP